MVKKLISVLTPTYNRAKLFLPQTIASVQAQHELGFEHEHIIIDNASTDNTRQVVAAFAKKDKRIKYIRNRKNVLASGALNRGFSASKGAFILPLDDDDLLMPDGLRWFFDFFSSNKSMRWVIARTIFIDQENRFIGRVNAPRVFKNFRTFMVNQIHRNGITNGGVMLRRAAVTKVGGWDQTYPASQDAVMWMRLLAHEQQVGLLDQYVTLYRIHPDRLSTGHAKSGRWAEVRRRLMEQYNITQAQVDKIG